MPEMGEERRRILGKIERVLRNFQETLEFGINPSLSLLDTDGNNNVTVFEVNRRNPRRFVLFGKILLNVYVLVKTNSYRTKRDIYYEHMRIFDNQRSSDDLIDAVTRLLRESRVGLHIVAANRGHVIGDLSFRINDRAAEPINCRLHPVPIPALPQEIVDIQSNARFILIVEKDATFQCLLDESACEHLHPCIILTARGYADNATKSFLHRINYELRLPLHALVDGDPYGVEIYMNYKYGSMRPRSYEVVDISLPSLNWLGVYPTETTKFPVAGASLIPLSGVEYDKASSMIRTRLMHEPVAAQELRYLVSVGYKTEIEAISAIGPGYLTQHYLKPKLAAMATESQREY